MRDIDDSTHTGLTRPLDWAWARQAVPALSSEGSGWRGALLRRWTGTSSVMVQPPLDHHYAVIHLGGAKQVNRRRDGPTVSSVVDNGSITLVPAGQSYVWRTEGPIAFAHLYISPRQLATAIGDATEADGAGASLVENVGCRDSILEPLFAKMIDEIATVERPSRLLLDALFESFGLRLAQRHSSLRGKAKGLAVALAPHRLRRVFDYIDANLGSDIGLADLMSAAGTSQFHFSRAFHLASGCSPYRYLLRRRIDYARVLLLATDESLEAISRDCGFNSRHQFSVIFKRVVGIGPKRFRLVHRAAPLAAGTMTC